MARQTKELKYFHDHIPVYNKAIQENKKMKEQLEVSLAGPSSAGQQDDHPSPVAGGAGRGTGEPAARAAAHNAMASADQDDDNCSSTSHGSGEQTLEDINDDNIYRALGIAD